MQEKQHVDAMIERVEHMKWQDEQRAKWMSGDEPQFVVPADCPF
jgi:hypothetical protein